MDGRVSMPFELYKNIHLVGIKGVAMTSLAQCLVDLGKVVTGSDIEDEFVTSSLLSSLNLQTYTSFSPEHLHEGTELVIYSGAHKGSQNPEVLAAKERGIPILSHADALGELMQGKRGISVCGVGGKSTVSAMITWILECAHKHPSFSVGVGNVLNIRKTGRYVADSEFFVAEADEYVKDPGRDNTPRFLSQHPEVIVCTNVAFDHPDVYKTFEDTKRAYATFFSSLPSNGTLVINGEDQELIQLAKTMQVKCIDVSSRPESAWSVCDYTSSVGKNTATLAHEGKTYTLMLCIPGKFNIMNATYAVAAAHVCGVSVEDISTALASFTGTMRRFENKGVKQNVQYYDDYAHHPTEVQATLTALREWYPSARVYAIFQPHTYSRTKALLHEFGESFSQANEAILLDIFASAREEADASISSDHVVQEIQSHGGKAQNLHNVDQVLEYLKSTVQPSDVVITLGAGDVYHLHSLC